MSLNARHYSECEHLHLGMLSEFLNNCTVLFSDHALMFDGDLEFLFVISDRHNGIDCFFEGLHALFLFRPAGIVL